MLASTHALAGAIIVSHFTSPTMGITAALISHPLLDLFPHWDFHTRTSDRSVAKVITLSLLDAGTGFVIGYFLFHNQVPPMVLFAAMFAAQLPDWLEAPYRVFNWNFPPFSTIKKIQSAWHTKLDLPWGLVSQLTILVLAIYLSI